MVEDAVEIRPITDGLGRKLGTNRIPFIKALLVV